MGSDPTISTRRDEPPGGALRAAIAVLALYAFVLQAFLGGLMPIPATGANLCAQHATGDAPPGKALPHDHGDCCTAAQPGAAALPARTAPASAIAWSAENAPRPLWTMIAEPRARAPPGSVASPRGPPAA